MSLNSPFKLKTKTNSTAEYLDNFIFANNQGLALLLLTLLMSGLFVWDKYLHEYVATINFAFNSGQILPDNEMIQRFKPW